MILDAVKTIKEVLLKSLQGLHRVVPGAFRGYPFAGEFWKLGHPNYFRLSLSQYVGTSGSVVDGDSVFSDKGSLKMPQLPAYYALKF
jgi:hypothetical protein